MQLDVDRASPRGRDRRELDRQSGDPDKLLSREDQGEVVPLAAGHLGIDQDVLQFTAPAAALEPQAKAWPAPSDLEGGCQLGAKVGGAGCVARSAGGDAEPGQWSGSGERRLDPHTFSIHLEAEAAWKVEALSRAPGKAKALHR